MGVRKKLRAEQLKEERKNKFFAKLNGCPTSPRKMRLVADLVRGVEVEKALAILKFSPKEAARNLEKVNIISYKQLASKKMKMQILKDAGLFVKEIYVDSASMLKRLRPAPQGTCA